MARPLRLYRESYSTIIPCSDELHEITVEHSGRVRLMQHPQHRAERAMVALGADEPRCLSMLRAWKTAFAMGHRALYKSLYASPLATVLSGALKRCQQRERARKDHALMAQALDWRERAQSRAREALPGAIMGAYRLGPWRARAAATCDVSWHHRRSALKRYRRGEYQLQIRPSWVALHRLGIAVIDGYFVLRLLGRGPDRTALVQIAYCDEGTDTPRTCYARTTPERCMIPVRPQQSTLFELKENSCQT